MPKKLPIQDAKDLAHKRGLRQVILLAWDGERTHVVTYGKSVEDCDQAAQGGERLKKVMGWPNWEAQPSRVKKLMAALDPFACAYRVLDALPEPNRSRIKDEDGARDNLPGVWPTVGDLRRASDLLPKNLNGGK